MSSHRQVPLRTIAREWGRIGCIGFGGPPAHITLLRKLCVERRRWLPAGEFEDGIAAANLLPGPASTQLAIFCAWRLAGPAGALLGGACFILPGLAVILGLAALFLTARPPAWIAGAAAGAGAAVPAVAAAAAVSLMPASWRRAAVRGAGQAHGPAPGSAPTDHQAAPGGEPRVTGGAEPPVAGGGESAAAGGGELPVAGGGPRVTGGGPRVTGGGPRVTGGGEPPVAGCGEPAAPGGGGPCVTGGGEPAAAGGGGPPVAGGGGPRVAGSGEPAAAGGGGPRVAGESGQPGQQAWWSRPGAPHLRWLAYLLLGGVAGALAGQFLVLVLAGCGLAEFAVRQRNGTGQVRASAVVPLALAAPAAGGLLALAWVAFKVGALSYGGGFVIIPLMQHDAVHTYHWMTGSQFLSAVALGQVTPGPVVQTVAVVGYAAARVGGGLLASLIAFSPSFTFVLAGAPRFASLRGNERVQAFLTGAGPAAIGAIGGAIVPLALELAHLWQAGIALLAGVWLLVLRRNVVAGIAGAACLGVIAALAGAPLR